MLFHHSAESSSKWIGSWNIDVTVVGYAAFLLLLWVVGVYDPSAISATLAAVVILSPVWLPVSLAVMFWITWIHYVRYWQWFNMQKTLLHVQLPAEVTKSPLAMEIFMAALWNTGNETTFIDRFWNGRGRPVWSLEIASNEGRVSFYIHLRKNMKDVTEAKLYGQFPEAKVTEVADYVDKVPFNLEEYDMWCGEYKKPNVPDALPIKTYIDFELDKNPDTPEIKTDPLSNLLELLNSRGPGEYLWVQIIIRANAKVDWYGIQTGRDAYLDPAKQKIKDIMAGAAKRAKEIITEEDITEGKMTLLTDGERDAIKAMERHMNKLIFQCGIRCLYIGKREVYRGITGASTFRLFDTFRNGWNELRGTRGLVGFDYPWEDFHNIRRGRMKKLFLFNYKYRAYFHVPYDQVPTFLSVEELASIWHFPSSAVSTPGLERVSSRVSGAPTNLPTGVVQQPANPTS